MPKWRKDELRNHANKLGSALLGVSSRKSTIVRFARKYHLIYFEAFHPDSNETPVIRGTTTAPDQRDANYCIGSHDDYDMTLVERSASVACEGYKTTRHRWYILQIDLKQARSLPFVFVGTKQQTKAYYARILAAHREVRHLTLNSASDKAAQLQATYALLASPAELPLLYGLFTDDVIDSMATYRYPFAIEICGDSVMIITEAKKPSEQLLDGLLHYGLWIARAIDSKLA